MLDPNHPEHKRQTRSISVAVCNCAKYEQYLPESDANWPTFVELAEAASRE
jgi:hypothetical protein